MSDSNLYDAWVADGKPFTIARPILECRTKLRVAFPGQNALFGTLGDPAHLLADRPEDHCPYSQTGWPLRHPYPCICALDIMHRPDLGLDCNKIFAHWLAAAKAGLLPWLKYLIWQAKRYDIRNGWVPVSSSGHFDHMHASQRTDHITTSIGGFHPLPGYGDQMQTLGQRNIGYATQNGLFGLQEPTQIPAEDGYPAAVWPNPLAAVLRAIVTGEDAQIPAFALIPGRTWRNGTAAALAAIGADVKAIRAAQTAPAPVEVDYARLAAAMQPMLEAMEARLTAEVRDAVADLGEKGAAGVRAES